MWIIAGLGNPGRRYARTRHNAGFDAIDCLAEILRIELRKEELYERGEGAYEGHELVLIKPLTFMNQSGSALRPLFLKEKNIEGMIVIHDDLDLPPGKIKLKRNGSSGGHRGVRSIIESLGTPDFYRIKIGIGRPQDRPAETYVLEKIPPAERETLSEAVSRSAHAALDIISFGLEKAMNLHHSNN